MKKFDRNEGRGFEKRGFGGRDRGGFGGRDNFSERKEMHQAVCSDCGNNCEVPFRPSGSKPVFCSDCFRGHDQAPARDAGRGRDFSSAPRRFEERAPRPSFSSGPKDNNIEDRLSALHVKLDKVIALLSDTSAPKTAVKEVKSEPKKEEPKKEEPKKKIDKKSNKAEPKVNKMAKKATKKVVKK
jgi:CxxC-x17-CxxC domain-containing protein